MGYIALIALTPVTMVTQRVNDELASQLMLYESGDVHRSHKVRTHWKSMFRNAFYDSEITSIYFLCIFLMTL